MMASPGRNSVKDNVQFECPGGFVAVAFTFENRCMFHQCRSMIFTYRKRYNGLIKVK